jgi:rubrerythrin
VVARATSSDEQSAQVIYKEKEIIREVVKVPCEYCGTLVEVTNPKCPSCGAPLKRY